MEAQEKLLVIRVKSNYQKGKINYQWKSYISELVLMIFIRFWVDMKLINKKIAQEY